MSACDWRFWALGLRNEQTLEIPCDERKGEFSARDPPLPEFCPAASSSPPEVNKEKVVFPTVYSDDEAYKMYSDCGERCARCILESSNNSWRREQLAVLVLMPDALKLGGTLNAPYSLLLFSDCLLEKRGSVVLSVD
ncbi:hypothetical protein KSP40_PGU018647 [Platanthera guangdongensis]|uniref:Uncharacterized protein n=1 Tax=Platanthera guangdongensis TaxID=2320717 RepID=A0ABR2MQS5_9ASPA